MTLQQDWSHCVDVAHAMGALLEAASSKFLELGALKRGHQVADLGCGDGGLAGQAAAMVNGQGGSVLGVDTCEAMISAATGAHAGTAAVRFAVQDAASPLGAPASFDAVFCRLALPFFSDPAAVLARSFDALRPGGRMCIMSIADGDHNAFVKALEGVGSPLVAHVLQAGRPETIAHQLEAAGFQQVMTKRIRALITVSDPAAYWTCIRGLFGFTQLDLPPAVADHVVPGVRLGIAITFAVGRRPDPAHPVTREVQTGEDAIALARRKAREISPTSLSQTFKGEPVVFLDVRDPASRVTKIKDSIHVTRDELENKLPAIVSDPARPIVVYCQNGNQSVLAVGQLRAMGYTNVWSLQRGIAAWEYVGMKVVPA